MGRHGKSKVDGLHKRSDGRLHIWLSKKVHDPKTGRMVVEHVNGKPVTFTKLLAKGISLGQARAELHKAISDFNAGKVRARRRGEVDAMPIATVTTLSEAFDQYFAEVHPAMRPGTRGGEPRKTGKRIIADQWLKAVGDIPIAQLSRHTLESYKSKRAQDGVKPATINRGLAFVKLLAREAAEREWSWMTAERKDELRRVKLHAEKSRVRWLSSDEHERLMQALVDSELRPMVLVAMNTSLRLGNIVEMRKSYVDLNKGLITYPPHDMKNDEAHEVPIPKALVPVLRAAMDERVNPSEWVFPRLGRRHKDGSRNAIPENAYPWDKTHASKAFNHLFAAARIDNFRFHDLRHDYATRMLRAGIPLQLVSKQLGHKSIGITLKVYGHITAADRRPAVETVSVADPTSKTETKRRARRSR